MKRDIIYTRPTNVEEQTMQPNSARVCNTFKLLITAVRHMYTIHLQREVYAFKSSALLYYLTCEDLFIHHGKSVGLLLESISI